MKNKSKNHNIDQNNNEEDFYVATECICDDDGVHYICPSCGKYHDSDFAALICCL